MKRIRIIRDDGDKYDDYRCDVLRIQDALMQAGHLAFELECRDLWRRYSDSMCAGWMCVPDDDAEIVACVRPYFEDGE